MNQKGVAVQALILVILFIGLVVTFYLSQNITNFFPKAAPAKPDVAEESFELELENFVTEPFTDNKTPEYIRLGDKFRIDIYTRSDLDLANLFVAKLNFPKEQVEVLNINQRSGQSLVKNWVEATFDNSTGTISIVGGVPSPGVKTELSQGSYLLASIILYAKKEGNIEISFDQASAIYSNSGNINIISNKKGLKFLVKDTSSISPIMSTPSAQEKILRNGDINRDNKFDLIDMSSLLTQFNPAKNKVTSEADLNGDGVINSFDFLKEREILISKGVIKGAAVTNEDIDTLDYFITNHQDKGLDGEHTQNYTDFANGHPMSQTILGNKSYYVKWASEVFEIHSWDDENIYLNEDHSGAPVNIYTFNPGIWLKRSMKVGDVITGANNTIQWYDNSCKKGSSSNFPIQITLEKHDPNYNIGGDLGVQDVIVVKYDSSVGLNSGVFERFYYSKEWGWIRWEEYIKSTGSLTNRRTFNKIISPIKPNAGLSCSAPYACPVSEWIDCMPVITPDGKGLSRPQCEQEYLKWAKENCPGFKGAAY